MGIEGAQRCAGHQLGHLPLRDGSVQLFVPGQGPVPELLLLLWIPGVEAEASWEHGGEVAGGYIL